MLNRPKPVRNSVDNSYLVPAAVRLLTWNLLWYAGLVLSLLSRHILGSLICFLILFAVLNHFVHFSRFGYSFSLFNHMQANFFTAR